MAAGFDDAAARAALHRVFTAALVAADPLSVLPGHLPEAPRGRAIVIGVGKAAAKMALAVERAWPDRPLSGLVVTTYGADLPDAPPGRRIPVRFASHPVPDAAGAAALADLLTGGCPD